MSAYFKASVNDFSISSDETIVGELSRHQTGVTPQQLHSWEQEVALLKQSLDEVVRCIPESRNWGLLLEYRMFRIHRRLDAVLLMPGVIVVIEFKMEGTEYDAASRRQVEDYSLDLRHFHAASERLPIIPVLCASAAPPPDDHAFEILDGVSSVLTCNAVTLGDTICRIANIFDADAPIPDLELWNDARYSPVPTIIEAAELLYAAHDVTEIHSALADEQNLTATTDRLIELIAEAHEMKRHYICFVTGVPGSGKTLTGLNAVHDPRFRENDRSSGAFLSGNSPLVAVLREALARDDNARTKKSMAAARSDVRTQVQGLMQFLQEYLDRDTSNPPHEHVVVFDEAQRAWNADYGRQKFQRNDSEPTLFFQIMNRHRDWSVIVALVGGGQEIHRGEGGLSLWGEALDAINMSEGGPRWVVHASPHVVTGSAATAGGTLFPEAVPDHVEIVQDQRLHLDVSIRSHRCERTNEWIDALLDGNRFVAHQLAATLESLPIYLTRSLDELRAAMQLLTRGHRRCGLVASSGARRLQGYGLGVSIGAQDLNAVCHWFLSPRDDVRSSFSLETMANEFACQGLELDYVGLCWGGDMIWDPGASAWHYQAFKGTKWSNARQATTQENIEAKYRVLMSRAREGLIIWVPPGSDDDKTRPRSWMDQTATFLRQSGVRDLHEMLERLHRQAM